VFIVIAYRDRKLSVSLCVFVPPGQCSAATLLDAVWGSECPEARTVDVHVGRLRKALNVGESANPIRTVRSAVFAGSGG
jgi:DNA-binding response OmpR family regulator